MSKHFMDKTQSMSRQNFDMAIILNSKGKQAGKIVVRYTESQIGWNNETGIIFHDTKDPEQQLNFSKTVRGSTYNQSAVYKLLESIGARVYNGMGRSFTANSGAKGCQTVDSVSTCRDFHSFKIGNEKFNILWV